MNKITDILNIQTLTHLLVLRPLVKLLFGANTVGKAHFHGLDNFIVIANHNSHLDTLLLFHIIPPGKIASTHILAALDYFKKPRLLYLLVNYFLQPVWVDRKSHKGSAIRQLQLLLDKGHSVILYPEGTRGEDDKLADFHKGIGLLAKNNPSIPIIPVYLKGPEKVLPKRTSIPLPLQNFITIFPPQKLDGEIAAITEKLHHQFRGYIDIEQFLSHQRQELSRQPCCVSVIGIDGCGKSTLSKTLAANYHGESCFIGDSLAFFNDGSQYAMQPLITEKVRLWVAGRAKKAKKLALYKIPKIAELLLRDHLIHEVARWYRPDCVVMDGSPLLNITAWSIIYHEDSFDRDTCAIALDILSGKTTPRVGDPLFKQFPELFALCRMQFNQLHIPEIVFFLDVSPEICIERIHKRGEPIQAHETIEKLSKLREAYEMVAEVLKKSGHSVCVIKADTLSPDQVTATASEYLREAMNQNDKN